MKYIQEMPDVIDFAYQIINLHRQNIRLKSDLEHYKKLHEMNTKALNRSAEHTKEMTATILIATIDPDSVINKGHQKILEEQQGV